MTQPATDILIPATLTNFDTGPATGQPTKVALSAGELANGAMVAGVSVKPQHVNYVENNHGLWIDHIRDDLNGQFGTGLDGDVTIAAGTTVLARDMAYRILTLQTGAVLDSNGFRIHAWMIIRQGSGRIHGDGGDGGAAGAAGTPGTAGAAAPAGSLGGGAPGVAGVNGTTGVGNAGTAVADSVGGDSGAGGATVAPAIAGGIAGVASDPGPTDGGTQSLTSIDGYIIGGGNAAPGLLTNLRGGAGGGSGACDSATDASGGSGGGGGIVSIRAHTLLLESNAGVAISADGGDGGAGESSGQDVGGSGGGGGGSVRIAYRRLYTGTALATATPREPADLAGAGVIVRAAGGTGSAGLSGANNGANGSAGTVVWAQI